VQLTLSVNTMAALAVRTAVTPATQAAVAATKPLEQKRLDGVPIMGFNEFEFTPATRPVFKPVSGATKNEAYANQVETPVYPMKRGCRAEVLRVSAH
jgi:hypothetical protein